MTELFTPLLAQITGLEEVTRNDLASVLVPAVFTFLVGIVITPWILKFLRKRQCWRKQTKLSAWGGKAAPITQKLNNDSKNPVPRMGGLVIVFAVTFVTLFFGLFDLWVDSDSDSFLSQLNFISRQETWLVIFSLVAGAIIGILDDLAVCGKLNLSKKSFGKYVGGGLSLRIRLAITILIGCVCAYWFHFKLGENAIQIPFGDLWQIGAWILPLMVLTVVGIYSGGVIDGVDGLSGGVFAIIFTIYGLIALMQGNFELATFCFAVTGSILAFLWYNIPPAKFYMSETGVMALTITLSIVAFMTNTIFLLPIIALPLIVTSLSVILQVFWKKFFKRKLFAVSPLHNLFRYKGHSDHSVVMKYWVISHITAIVGLSIYLLGYPNNFLQ